MSELFQRLRTSVTVKLLFIGFLVLILLIPMGMVRSVIYERNHLYLSAKQDIMNAWGREQTVGGPVLTLPYRVMFTDDKGIKRIRKSLAHFLPQRLSVRGRLETEMRYRGIYQVPVYTADLELSGRFAPPDLARLGIQPHDVDWDEAYLSVAVADARGIKKPMRLRSDAGDGIFEPGGVKVRGFDPQVIVPLPGLAKSGAPVGISIRLRLEAQRHREAALSTRRRPDRGAADLRVAIAEFRRCLSARAGGTSTTRASVPNGRCGILAAVTRASGATRRYRRSSLPVPPSAVNLFVPVSTYQKSTRAAKYAILFIGLSFLAYFMFEVFGNLRLHPFQYLLIGFANCLFYLLLLSLSEHTSFVVAYGISAAASTALVVGYSVSILKSLSRVLTMLALLTGLYTFLYVTLRAEQYAMLIGAAALFIILATVMYLTRRLDWYRVTLDLGPDWPAPGAGASQQATRTA